MSTQPVNKSEHYSKSVCFFLSEMLRTRQVTLERAADIASRIIKKIDEVQTEDEFLELIRILEQEFQVLQVLEDEISFVQDTTERMDMEKMVREFAINHLPDDPDRALAIMEDALLPNTDLEQLCLKYQDFNNHVKRTHHLHN